MPNDTTSVTGLDAGRAPTIESRRHQMFPTLSATDVNRLRRFGDERSYRAGEHAARAGAIAPGLQVVLSGEVRVSPHEEHMRDDPIVTHTAGSFMGELAQLSGRPSLVDAIAVTNVDVIVISTPRLRDLMVEEADLGERVMRALILRRVRLLERGVGGPIIVGDAHHRDVLRLEGFLARNGHPYQRFDPDADDCARTLLERFHLTAADLPIVVCVQGQMLRNPSERQLARCIGLDRAIDASVAYDVAIVGTGPAGLAAAVYASSEGLSAITIDCRAFGGQAGASARIENYLGFPTGISGIALMARAHNQMQKFGAETAIPNEVSTIEAIDLPNGPGYLLGLKGGETIRTHSVVIATGAQYRRLDVANLADFEGTTVHYWASTLERRLCNGAEVALVGAGNSAGQAAVYLAAQVAKLSMIVRGDSLDATMSHYLCERIRAIPNIDVLVRSEVVGIEGELGALRSIRVKHRETGVERRRDIRHLFLFIGAEPETRWLSASGVETDSRGFIRADALAGGGRLPFETNRPGVFAIGDVRSGSIKRVAAAVGEGAQVVAALHVYLARSKGLSSPIVAQTGTIAGEPR
jgi:thioredoxin reductase (NADPH)